MEEIELLNSDFFDRICPDINKKGEINIVELIELHIGKQFLKNWKNVPKKEGLSECKGKINIKITWIDSEYLD